MDVKAEGQRSQFTPLANQERPSQLVFIVSGKVTGAEECFDSLHKFACGIWDPGQFNFGLGSKGPAAVSKDVCFTGSRVQ